MSDPSGAAEAQRVRRPAGAARKRRVVGRGSGSGRGGTSGRGTKGQRARAGSGVRPGFEGGQMPLYRRIARRGFSNHPFRTVYQTVDVRDLNRFVDGDTVDRQALLDAGVIGTAGVPVKLLGSGMLERALTVLIDRASAGARQKVTAAGGSLQFPGEAQPAAPVSDGSTSDGSIADEPVPDGAAPGETSLDGPAPDRQS